MFHDHGQGDERVEARKPSNYSVFRPRELPSQAIRSAWRAVFLARKHLDFSYGQLTVR